MRILELLIRVAPDFVLDVLWTAIDDWRGLAAMTLRYTMAKKWAIACGNVVAIGPGVEIRGWNNLCLGDHVSVHRGCYLDATGGLTIGSNVSIAHQTTILTTNHTWDDFTQPIRDNPISMAPVTISDDVWIGCGCRIMPGVAIQHRSVVAAGAVVTRDVPEGTDVGGIPTKVLKNISPMP
jgi:acetyltransferase-like isoleucine patch superfamily enzyme